LAISLAVRDREEGARDVDRRLTRRRAVVMRALATSIAVSPGVAAS